MGRPYRTTFFPDFRFFFKKSRKVGITGNISKVWRCNRGGNASHSNISGGNGKQVLVWKYEKMREKKPGNTKSPSTRPVLSPFSTANHFLKQITWNWSFFAVVKRQWHFSLRIDAATLELPKSGDGVEAQSLLSPFPKTKSLPLRQTRFSIIYPLPLTLLAVRRKVSYSATIHVHWSKRCSPLISSSVPPKSPRRNRISVSLP